MPKEDRAALSLRFEQYRDYWGPLYDEIEAAEKFYNLEFDITRPEDVTPIIPPNAHTDVERAVNELVTDAPKVRRRRDGHSEAQKRDDDEIEAALQNFLLDLEEYLDAPVLHESAKSQFVHGGVVLAGPFWNSKSNRVWFEPYDLANVLMEPGPEPREGFVHMKLTVAEMEQLAERDSKLSSFKKGDRKATDEITLVRWFSFDAASGKGEQAAWIEDDSDFLQAPGVLGYPYLPLDVVSTGWGRMVLGTRPEEKYVGMLDKGARSLYRSQAEMFTFLQSHAGEQVWGRYKAGPDTDFAEGFKMTTLPNSITRDWPAGLERMESDPLSPAVEFHFERLTAMVGSQIYNPVLGGERIKGVTTATGQLALTGRARRRFYPPLRFLRAGVSRVLYKLGLLVKMATEVHGESFSFEWRGAKLTAAMYHDDYSVEVELLAEDEEERRIKIAEGATLDGKIPQRMLWEDFYGIENYAAAFEDWLVEQIVRSPEWMQSVLAGFGQGLIASKSQGSPGQAGGGQPLQDLATAFRAARTGFPQTQAGTVEGVAQQLRAPRMLPAG